MTTLCIADLASNVVLLNPARSPDERAQIAAGAAAYNRALTLGYCNTAARALQRSARLELQPGETAEACARRIVPLHADSVMVSRTPRPPRGPTLPGAA
jgi:hypothetical protein